MLHRESHHGPLWLNPKQSRPSVIDGDAPYTGMLGRWTFNARSSEETGEKLVLRPGVCTWKPNVLTEFEAIKAFSRYRRLKDAPSGLASDPPPKSYQLGAEELIGYRLLAVAYECCDG